MVLILYQIVLFFLILKYYIYSRLFATFIIYNKIVNCIYLDLCLKQYFFKYRCSYNKIVFHERKIFNCVIFL